jgi:hypothetical protein
MSVEVTDTPLSFVFFLVLVLYIGLALNVRNETLELLNHLYIFLVCRLYNPYVSTTFHTSNTVPPVLPTP